MDGEDESLRRRESEYETNVLIVFRSFKLIKNPSGSAMRERGAFFFCTHLEMSVWN